MRWIGHSDKLALFYWALLELQSMIIGYGGKYGRFSGYAAYAMVSTITYRNIYAWLDIL